MESCLHVEHGQYEALSVDALFEDSGHERGWLEFGISRCSCTSPILMYLDHSEQQVGRRSACVQRAGRRGALPDSVLVRSHLY